MHFEYRHPTRQGVKNLTQGDPHLFGFRDAGGKGAIALFELLAQLDYFTVQLPVSILQPIRRTDECSEGIGQLTLCDLWCFRQPVHWNPVRTRQHLPSCYATGLPKHCNSGRTISKVTRLNGTSRAEKSLRSQRCIHCYADRAKSDPSDAHFGALWSLW